MKDRQYVLKNVVVWDPDLDPKLKSIKVSDGIVRQISDTEIDAGDCEVIDGKGQALVPIGVDLQVHLRVPGQPKKETAETGLRAALRGGVGLILNMPNTYPVLDSKPSFDQGLKELGEWEKKLDVKVLWSSAITRGMLGRELCNVKEMIDSGISAFTDDGLGVESDELMDQAFGELEETNIPFLQHAETPGHGGVLAPGPVQSQLDIPPYFEEAETSMVERDLRLLEKHPKARYHVLHVSSRKTLDLLRSAKSKGLRATGEVTPHHLFFSSDDIEEGNTSFKMNPPIRSSEDREALWKALADGTLEYMATDHAPHEANMKGQRFVESAFGTTGLETSLRVLLWGVKRGKLTPQRLVQVFATRAAEFIGLADQYGRIEEGREFRAVLVDTDAPEHPVNESDLDGLSKNNCFLGRSLPGAISSVFNQSGIYNF